MKTVKRIIYLIVFGICSAIVLFKCNNPFKKEAQQVKINSAVKKAVTQQKDFKKAVADTTTHKEVKGVEVAQNTIVAGSKKQIKSVYKKQLKNTVSITGSNAGSLQSISNFALTSSVTINGRLTKITDTINKTDTAPEGYYITIDQDCYKGYALVNKDVDSLDLHLTNKVNIHGVISYRAKHHLLWIKWLPIGKPTLTNSIWSDCKSVHIDSIKTIEITRKRKG